MLDFTHANKDRVYQIQAVSNFGTHFVSFIMTFWGEKKNKKQPITPKSFPVKRSRNNSRT